MRLAQDEPKENDHSFAVEGYRFIVAQDIKELAGDITIDASITGIKVISKLSSKKTSSCC